MRSFLACLLVLAACGLVASAKARVRPTGVAPPRGPIDRLSAPESRESALTAIRPDSSAPPLLGQATKLVVVTTAGWDAIPGTLLRYERKNARWTRVGHAVPIVVGRSGMAWDPVLQNGHEREFVGPVKREGDGRSPAGVFALTRTFGYAGVLPGSNIYLPLTQRTECVDDAGSSHYAQLVERDTVARVDWTSSERMRRSDDLYRWGVVVDYNMSRTVPGAGSCIFLHIWSGPEHGTAGCTAMAPDAITAIVNWIDGTGRAALVQLPLSEYKRLRAAWSLPELR